MLDIKFIRDNPELIKKSVADRHDSAPIDEILELDAERRQKVGELDNLRQQRKAVSKDREKAPEVGRRLRVEIQALEEDIRQLDGRLEERLLDIPNPPEPDVPLGVDDNDNVEIRTWGQPRTFAFEPKPHWELGEALDIIDFERGVKISGSRFYILKGYGACLQRALIAFMLDLHTTRHGYREVYPPYMVKRDCMVGSAQLPRLDENIYRDVEDDLWLVGTAEIPVTNLYRDEILAAEALPIHYVAYTACFRREKMSAGKDTRGIKRGHQFDKVELYKFVTPETSAGELEKLTADAEDVCQKLELPYRVRELCTGDLGFHAKKSYDIDVWAPGCQEWLEVSSCSNCGDFQARRANLRYRPGPEEKPRFLHTLNGSGLALPRIMIAVMENYQQPNGYIAVPEVLQDFMKTKVITK